MISQLTEHVIHKHHHNQETIEEQLPMMIMEILLDNLHNNNNNNLSLLLLFQFIVQYHCIIPDLSNEVIWLLVLLIESTDTLVLSPFCLSLSLLTALSSLHWSGGNGSSNS